MTHALELVAGLVLMGALATSLTVLAAFELGRMMSRDDDQRALDVARLGNAS
jgi:hypothetical protein